MDEIVLVGGSTRIPKVQALVKEFFNGKQPVKGVNPDEAVAYGAAVQAAVLSKAGEEELNSMVLLDVTPISLGIRLNTGAFRKIISRNTAIPVVKTKAFNTVKDYQKKVRVKIYEGERAMAEDNHKLGELVLDNLPVMKANLAKVDVEFEVCGTWITALALTALASPPVLCR